MSRPDFDARPCQFESPEIFFSDTKAERAYAKQVCAGCPIRVRCLSWALDMETGGVTGRWGIYGGLDEAERAQLARQAS
jgi:hypothetical protein